MTYHTRLSPDFEQALALYLRTRDALDALPETVSCDDEMIPCAAFREGQREMLATRSETVADFRVKFEALFSDPMGWPGRAEMLLLFADLRHLTGNAPSLTFQTSQWLAWYTRMGGGWCVRSGEVCLFGPAESKDLEDPLFMLNACGARELVKQEILSREPAAEVA